MTTGKLNAVTAAVVFAVMMIVYLLTVSPTISFWDSSEFVACSYIMGIPHPPGAPLLSLVGRVMMIVPFFDFRGTGFESIAYRINLLAVLTGALTVLLTYLITVKLITRLSPFTGRMSRDVPVIFSAAITAFLVGFSHQFWGNAVEIETYMPSLFVSLLTVWLVLRWDDARDETSRFRYLILAAYLMGLGIGIHLYVLLMVPTLLFIVITGKPAWFSPKRLWLSLISLFAVYILAGRFGGRGLTMTLMVILSIAGPLMIVRYLRNGISGGKRTLLGAILCLSIFAVGYSVYPTIMVRAGKNPAINQGRPNTLSRYRDYLDRTQYGQGNMYTGMFDRAAPFGYQFGFMYIRYLFEQFPKWGPSPAVTFANDRLPERPGQPADVRRNVYPPVILLLVLVFGLVYHARKDTRLFAALFLYVLVSSLGLVLYLNMENPQVRERGYFFLGSYVGIMVWVGIGMHGCFALVKRWFPVRFRAAAAVTLALVFATVIPSAARSRHLDPRYSNYQVHDRSRNWIPYDYAVNILQSCDENAILFTHGDNDTYPLWYAQHVEGVRVDVNVINLSILNAPWYIKQLRDGKPPVPITYSDDYIDMNLCGGSLRSYRTALWTPDPKEVTVAGITWDMQPNYLSSDRKSGFLFVSSIMTVHIIENVNWSRPIYFSTYVEPAKLLGIEEYLSLEGLVFSLTRESSGSEDYAVSLPALEHAVNSYRYRGITDSEVYKQPDTVKLLQNYFIGFLELSYNYAREGDTERSVKAARTAYEFSLGNPNRLTLLESVLTAAGLGEEVRTIMGKD